MRQIGLNIRKIREQKGFSQEYIAHELGINQSTYGKIERDDSNLSVDRLIKIAEILEEDLSSLLDIGTKNTFNNQTNSGYGYGYVENINNDFKDLISEIKNAYEKIIQSKDEQIKFLKEQLSFYKSK